MAFYQKALWEPAATGEIVSVVSRRGEAWGRWLLRFMASPSLMASESSQQQTEQYCEVSHGAEGLLSYPPIGSALGAHPAGDRLAARLSRGEGGEESYSL